MKLVKPMVVSFSYRTFLVQGQQRLSVTSLIGFALDDTGRRLISEVALWPAIGEATAGAIDEGLPKARGEILVYGSCYTPGARPLPVSYVRVLVGSVEPTSGEQQGVDKKLAVFGDRYWAGTAVRGPSSERVPHSHEASDPVPFSEMPLTWERAFGGEACPQNPLGRGMARIPVGDGIERLPLPNVELGSNLVTASTQLPEPAGFGPLDVMWPQRHSKTGTYDARWLQEDFPGYARDTDPAFFSTAPHDQRIEGFFRGDEEYVLENMHPSRPIIRGNLPGVAARVLVRRQGGLDVEDVKTRLDTVVFLPGAQMGILVFRGLTPVTEDDAADISCVLAACEDLAAPRSVAHYAEALSSRLDKEQSGFLALKEHDLVPSFAVGSGMAALLKNLSSDGEPDPLKTMTDRAMARVRQQLVDEGVDDPDGVLARAQQWPPGLEPLAQLPDFTDPESVAAYEKALEELDVHFDKQMQEAELQAERQLEEARRDGAPIPANALVAGAVTPGKGPPVPQAPQQLAMFREAGIEPDPTLVEKLHSADAVVMEAYREMAHYMAPAPPLGDDARNRARILVSGLLAQGTSFAGRDCTRYDLSELDLRKADFRNTLLEGADLERANAAGVDMSGAILAHARLRDTRFDGANLEGANLGSAVIDDATFVGANLRRAVFARTKLRSASFKGADLTGIDWLEVELGAVDFEAVLAPGMDFFPGGDLTRCRFPGAKLKKANFLERKLDGVDFAEADLELVTFLTVTANGASFRGASLRKFHAVLSCSFEGANFQGADLTGAFLRGSNLRGASFEGAQLEGADLSECDLTGANLTGARAKELLMIRANLTDAKLEGANLMEAMLQKSKLHGADLSRTNLFAANLGLVRLDNATKIKDANLKRALMLPRARKTT